MSDNKYRKKPVVIEAVQLRPETFKECLKFAGYEELAIGACQNECAIVITTLEGDMKAERGDWIIKGVKGEFYPCKNDIFEATYDKVSDNNTQSANGVDNV